MALEKQLTLKIRTLKLGVSERLRFRNSEALPIEALPMDRPASIERAFANIC